MYDYDVVQKIDNFSQSYDSLAGHKILIINGFTRGEAITFNIDAASPGSGGSKV